MIEIEKLLEKPDVVAAGALAAEVLKDVPRHSCRAVESCAQQIALVIVLPAF